jgi:hypothetical protein
LSIMSERSERIKETAAKPLAAPGGR